MQKTRRKFYIYSLFIQNIFMKQTQKKCIKFRLFTQSERKVKLIQLSRDERKFMLQKSNNIVRVSSTKAIDCSRLDGKTFST